MDINRQTGSVRHNGILFLVLAFVGTALTALGGVAFVFMLVLPALWAHAALRTRLWVLPLLALEALLVAYAATGAWQPALLVWLVIAPAGAAVCLLQKAKMGNFYTTFFSSVLLAAGLYACVCGPSLIAGRTAFAGVQDSIMAAGEMMKPLYAAAGMGDIWALLFDAGTLSDSMALMGVPVLYALGAVFALSNVLLLHAMNRGRVAELCPLSPFASWRVPRAFVNILFFLMLAGVIASLSGSEWGASLAYAVFTVWVMPMALVGLSVIYGRRKRLAPVIVLAVLCVPLYLYVPPALAVVGMFGSRVRRGVGGADNDGGGV